MAMTDPISDLIVRIKAAILRRRDTVDLPSSKLKKALVDVLKNEGFIQNYDELTKGKKRVLRIRLRYAKDQYGKIVASAITEMKRISSPGCRVYKHANELNRISGGFVSAILSTSSGLKTDNQARMQKIGGEVLLHVS